MICPGFELWSLQADLKIEVEIRLWQEHESPAALVGRALAPLLEIRLDEGPMDDDEAARVIAMGIDMGYRMVDTAFAYGNEAGVGRGVHDSSVPREEIVITTKFNAHSHSVAGVAQAWEDSARLLGVDYIDQAAGHAAPAVHQAAHLDPLPALRELMQPRDAVALLLGEAAQAALPRGHAAPQAQALLPVDVRLADAFALRVAGLRVIPVLADEVIAGKHAGEFPVDVFQDRDGAATVANVCEVIGVPVEQVNPRAVMTLNYMLDAEPEMAPWRKLRGMLLLELKRFSLAQADLEVYLTLQPEAADAEFIRQQILSIRQWAARNN